MNKKVEEQMKYMSKKKKVISAIAFVLVALVVGTVVHGLFLKDTTKSKTIDHTKVVENEVYKDIPKDDSTPADYSPEENISICQSVIQNMDAWTSKTEGTAVADVLFINYTQNISASKVIKNGSATQQTASESSLLSTGQQRTFKDDAILIRDAKKVKSLDDIQWEDDFTAVSKDTYAQNYGRTPFALTNYVIDQTTIIKSKTLDSDKGKFKYEYELKPDESTVYYKRQMKTEGGASDYPKFHSVKVTVTMDEQWRPLVIHYSENYDINISVVGDVTCQGEVTETFADFGEVKALPDQDLVDDYIKNKYDKNKLSDLPTKEGADISKYIIDMFTKNPYYNVKLTVGNRNLNIGMYVDIQKGTIKIKEKDLFAAYSNKKVYIQYGDIKVSMKADSVFEAIEIIGNAVDFDTESIDFDYLSQIDLNNISLDDETVSGLLNNVRLEQSDDAIKVAFAKDGIKADVKVTLQDESVSLDYANVSLKPGDYNVVAKITTAKKKYYPNLKGFKDISKVTTLLQPWVNTVNAKGIAAKISVGTKNVSLSGNAVFGYKPLKLKFTTKIDDVKIKAIVVRNTVYISTGNIKVKCKLKNIESTLKKVMVMTGIDVKKNQFVPKQYADTIHQLKNGNINVKKLTKSVSSISFKDGSLHIGASINKLKYKVSISKNTIKINQGKNLKVKAKITKKYKKSPKISVKKSQYVSAKVILNSLSKISLYKLLKSKGIILDTRISVGGFTLKGVAKAAYSKGFQIKYTTNIEGVPITLIYKKNAIYVKSGKVMIKGSSENTYTLIKKVLQKTSIKMNHKTLLQANSFHEAFESLVKEYAGNLTIKDIIGNVKTFKYKNGYLIIQYKYTKGKTATIKLKKKTLSLSAAVLNMNLNAKLKIKKIYTKSPAISVHSKNYTKLSDILNVVEKLGLEEILASTGMDTDVTLNIAGKSIKANIKADYGDTKALLITTNVIEGKVTIPVTIRYINNLFYIDAANVHIKAAKNNIQRILSQTLEEQNFSEIFAKDFAAVVKDITDQLSAKDIINNIKLFSCNKNTLNVQYILNNNVLDISVTGRTVTVKGINIDNKKIDFSAKINNTKNQNIVLTNGEQYVDFGTAYAIFTTNIDKINHSKAFGIKADMQIGNQNISADIIYDKSNSAYKLTIPYNNEVMEVTYLDDIIYAHFGKFYIKTTKEKLLEIVEKYSGYELDKIFAGNDIKEQISLALILNIKSIAVEDGKLNIVYVQNNVELTAVIEDNRDEINIAGIEIGDTSVNGKIALEEFYDKSMIHVTDYTSDKYFDLNKALEIIDIDSIQNILQSKGLLFDINATANDYTIEGQLKVALGDKPVCQLNTTIEGVDTVLTVKEDKLYINASNINLFYENISGLLSNVSDISNFSQIMDKITDIKIADHKIQISIALDEKNGMEVLIEKQQIQVTTKVDGVKFEAQLKIREIYDSEPNIVIKKADYSNMTDIINVLKKFGIEDLINATGIKMNVAMNLNDTVITGQLTYMEDSLYLHIGNIYLKADIAYVLSIMKENGLNIGGEISVKEIVDAISEFICSEDELSFVYNADTPLKISISDNSISINEFVQGDIVDTNVTEVENVDKYIELKDVIQLVKTWKKQPAAILNATIQNRALSVVYENKMVYVTVDGLKLKSDDGSVASIINAVFKIYGVDITPILEELNILEDEKDINLDMFKQYADLEAINGIMNNGNISLSEVLDNISIDADAVSYRGKSSDNEVEVILYNSATTSYKPDDNGYIDAGSMDTLLKAFGKTAGNLNFDVSANANLALSLGIIHINLKDVPLSAKLQVEKEGVYGNVHAEVPYMKSITDNNISVPDTTTETTESTSKTKTEVKTSYSLVSDSEIIYTDFFVTPEYIYIHKNIKYQLTKTVTTTDYKKILVWIPQSSKKQTETVIENKDFYIKRTYKEMQNNIMLDLCFALNMTDSIRDKMIDSSNSTDIETARLGNIVKSYSFDNTGKFDFELNLSSLTDGAITDTNINLYRNGNGYLDNLYVKCKLYSLIAIELDADLKNIGQTVDIGFDPQEIQRDKNYN